LRSTRACAGAPAKVIGICLNTYDLDAGGRSARWNGGDRNWPWRPIRCDSIRRLAEVAQWEALVRNVSILPATIRYRNTQVPS
jgi:hypothetical protein